jgi:zinc/manganese transport system substrate-binding protein
MRQITTFVWVFALTICVSDPVRAKTLHVVASFSILADVVKQIGGSGVIVKGLVPPDGDPHEFEPSPDDARALKEADIAFLSGEGLESWFQRLANASGYKGEAVIVSTGIDTISMEEDGKAVTDPHVWNSIRNVIVWANNIQKALSSASPEDTAKFKSNAESYTKELEQLDAYAKVQIGAIPHGKRKVLTSHDAFGYFSRAYGVSFLSPIGLSTESEASAGDVAKLIDQIKKEGVKVYFIENSNDPRLVQQIAAATGARPGGKLYVESLSPHDGPAATYTSLFRYNVDQITAAISK